MNIKLQHNVPCRTGVRVVWHEAITVICFSLLRTALFQSSKTMCVMCPKPSPMKQKLSLVHDIWVQSGPHVTQLITISRSNFSNNMTTHIHTSTYVNKRLKMKGRHVWKRLSALCINNDVPRLAILNYTKISEKHKNRVKRLSTNWTRNDAKISEQMLNRVSCMAGGDYNLRHK